MRRASSTVSEANVDVGHSTGASEVPSPRRPPRIARVSTWRGAGSGMGASVMRHSLAMPARNPPVEPLPIVATSLM